MRSLGFFLIVLIGSLFRVDMWLSRHGDCLAEEKSATVPDVPSFESDIQPLLKEKCWKCHGANSQKGELALHTPALIQKGGESGAVVIAGQSAESRLFELVKQGEMPPDRRGTLTQAEVDLFRRWIDGGASFGTGSTDQSRAVTQHDVIPALLLRCTVCHGRHKQEGGLDLRNREAMLRGGKSGPAFVAGKPDESLMLKRIRAEEMPPHPRLTEVSVKPMEPEETKTLARWIELGAPLAPDAPDLAGTVDDPLVRPQDKEFWSLRAPRPTAVPLVTGVDQLQSSVDAFIARNLIEKGLQFSERANRLSLLRRVTFDLIGLPPSPSDAQEFLEDQAPDAFERVVDRLLASPCYGERWGRHWLDVAGYAETEGRREQHLPRPFAWRYRDYVIRSMSMDKPFDRFLLEQIAGDELADYEHAATITQEIEDNLVATAFLRLAPDPTWANLTGFVPDRLEVMADSIDVIGSGVMGLTFKCARCHTHKFDPIPQRDYYRLVALLKGAYDEHDWLKPQLISYGGAMSAGLGERFLPYVTTEERRAWELQSPDPNRPPEPRIMALWDRGDPSPTYVYRRGNHATSGSFVTPGAPAALCDSSKKFEIAPPWPGAKSTGRRLALAKWLTEPTHPLTARVIVNRIWKHHFGQGIVRSLGNFGKMGDRPTHPELLDNLSLDFIRRGWSMKSLHRQLVLSATYQQDSAVSEKAQSLDSANWLLSRMPLSRLDAEELRDSILMVADELNHAGGGPPEPVQVRPDGLVLTGRRRSIYVQQLRKHPPSLLESFDLPSMNPNCLQRSDSLVPTQALHLWNDAAIRQQSARFADRVLQITDQWRDTNQNSNGKNPGRSDTEKTTGLEKTSPPRIGKTLSPVEANDAARQIQSASSADEHSIEQVYWIALGRPPRPEETAACLESLSQLKSRWLEQTKNGDAAVREATRRAFATLCHTILNSADFLYID